MNRLSKSDIDYLDYVWNFYSGCRNRHLGNCMVPNCWARSITNRFHDHYPNGFEPTFYPEGFLSPLELHKPARIGVAFMGDLFGQWVDPHAPSSIWEPIDGKNEFTLREMVFYVANSCPQHQFIFLTKCPWNLPVWGIWPDNCWAGATAVDAKSATLALYWLERTEAKHRWISFEPLLENIFMTNKNIIQNEPLDRWKRISQFVIGAQTNPYVAPKIECVRSLYTLADALGISVFTKNNMSKLFETPNGQSLSPRRVWA